MKLELASFAKTVRPVGRARRRAQAGPGRRAPILSLL